MLTRRLVVMIRRLRLWLGDGELLHPERTVRWLCLCRVCTAYLVVCWLAEGFLYMWLAVVYMSEYWMTYNSLQRSSFRSG